MLVLLCFFHTMIGFLNECFSSGVIWRTIDELKKQLQATAGKTGMFDFSTVKNFVTLDFWNVKGLRSTFHEGTKYKAAMAIFYNIVESGDYTEFLQTLTDLTIIQLNVGHGRAIMSTNKTYLSEVSSKCYALIGIFV